MSNDALTQAIKESQGQITIRTGSASMCANRDEEWVVYRDTTPPKLLYRGVDQSAAVWCLVRGRALPDETAD